MKIAIDAMGGDYAPSIVVEGVAMALRDFSDVEIVLVGHIDKMSFYLEKFGIASHPRITKVHAEEVVEMDEPPVVAIRGKKNSSMTVCAKVVKNGEAEAIVSAGHTGAAVASTKVIVRALEGIDRPAIATAMPGVDGKWILLDSGANTDCKPINLAQFALMGEAYASMLLGIESPKIGLLNVGGEDSKGNELTKDTFKILSKMPINFVGNVEGSDVFKNVADVVVCDGFVGNVLLKGSESLASATMHWLKDVFTKNTFRKTSAILNKNAFKELKAVADAEEHGGAPLIGLKKICIIGHGSSTPKSIRNAIKVAAMFVRQGINERISRRLEESNIVYKVD